MVEVSHVHIPGSTRPSLLPPLPLPRELPARCMSNKAYWKSRKTPWSATEHRTSKKASREEEQMENAKGKKKRRAPGNQQPNEKRWENRFRGTRDLARLRIMQVANQPDEFKQLGDDPDKTLRRMEVYPSDLFLSVAPHHHVNRYCAFLLQSCLLLCRVFRVDRKLEGTYGVGSETSARMALLFLHTTKMENPEARLLKSLPRHLYARMVHSIDSQNQQAVDDIVTNEWKDESLAAVGMRLDAFIEDHLHLNVVNGIYPKTNISVAPAKQERQWDHSWQVPRVLAYLTHVSQDLRRGIQTRHDRGKKQTFSPREKHVSRHGRVFSIPPEILLCPCVHLHSGLEHSLGSTLWVSTIMNVC